MTDLVPLSARITETGAVIEPGLSLEEWLDVGRQLGRAQTGLHWAIGDWAIYGTDHFPGGESVRAQVEYLGYAAQTVANTISVCRRVPHRLRRADLSFSHHAEIAHLSGHPKRQERYLRMAAENGLQVRALRAIVAEEEAELAAARAVDPPPAAPVPTVGKGRDESDTGQKAPSQRPKAPTRPESGGGDHPLATPPAVLVGLWIEDLADLALVEEAAQDLCAELFARLGEKVRGLRVEVVEGEGRAA